MGSLDYAKTPCKGRSPQILILDCAPNGQVSSAHCAAKSTTAQGLLKHTPTRQTGLNPPLTPISALTTPPLHFQEPTFRSVTDTQCEPPTCPVSVCPDCPAPRDCPVCPAPRTEAPAPEPGYWTPVTTCSSAEFLDAIGRGSRHGVKDGPFQVRTFQPRSNNRIGAACVIQQSENTGLTSNNIPGAPSVTPVLGVLSI